MSMYQLGQCQSSCGISVFVRSQTIWSRLTWIVRLLLIISVVHWCIIPTIAWSETSDALRAELKALDSLRRGRKTPFAEAEKRAAELLKKYPEPADQGQIYFTLVQVYGQSAGSPERIIYYAKKALQLPLLPQQQSRLHTYWGDAIFVLDPSKPRPERRREAATVFLAGMIALRKLDLPEKAPDIPAVELQDFPGENVQQAEERNKREMAAVEEARFLRTMVRQRDILTGQIVWLYAEKPHAMQELRELAIKTTDDPKLADRLLQMVDRKIKGVREPKIPSQKESEEKTEEEPKKLVMPAKETKERVIEEPKREVPPKKESKEKASTELPKPESSASRREYFFYLAAGIALLILIVVFVLRKKK